MALEYRLYGNSGIGDPVNYATPIGTTAGLTFTTAVLAPASDNTFALRVYDTASGLEESNTDARVRLVVAADGSNATGLPPPPTGLSAVATVAGGARASWQFAPVAGAALPTGFHVYLGIAGISFVPFPYHPVGYFPQGYQPTNDPTSSTTGINYATIRATVPYARGRLTFTGNLAGLSDGVTYLVSVRSYNAVGEEANTGFVLVTGDASGPAAVDGLAAVAVA